jgi:hypothetical protein
MQPAFSQVDVSTLNNKIVWGYQGWFAVPGDGSAYRWGTWGSPPNIPMWPDTSEFPKKYLASTLPDGSPAHLYSAYDQSTVVKQFEWMKTYGIDGVMPQRFMNLIKHQKQFIDRVQQNIRVGAELHGRSFSVMYDISGEFSRDLIKNDWISLVDGMQLTASPSYQMHNGRPVVGLWGFGFPDRPGTPPDLIDLADWFHNNPDPKYRATLIGGVPPGNEGWGAFDMTQFDIISPWYTGRVRTMETWAWYYPKVIVADQNWSTANGKEFMPVIYPGFKAHWTKTNAPRMGGKFLWQQFYQAINGGATMCYGAMFDEFNEGTQIAKTAPTPADQPTTPEMVALDADGYKLPSDWYLQVAGAGGKMLRREIPVTAVLPINP